MAMDLEDVEVLLYQASHGGGPGALLPFLDQDENHTDQQVGRVAKCNYRVYREIYITAYFYDTLHQGGIGYITAHYKQYKI